MDTRHINPEFRRFAVPIDSVVPDPHNYREHGSPDDRDIMELRESIRLHGQQRVAILDPEGRVTAAGAGMWIALKAEGYDCIAAVPYADHPVDEQQLRDYKLRDNRTQEFSVWNKARLLEDALADPELNKLLDSLDMTSMVFPSVDGEETTDSQDVDDNDQDPEEDEQEQEQEHGQRDMGRKELIKPEGISGAYPYIGGKRVIAGEVWARFGEPDLYVEPFYGKGSIHLGRPGDPEKFGYEIINDINAFIPNFWRATSADPDSVAAHANNLANDVDAHARENYLIQNEESLYKRLVEDPEFYDPRMAGWWVWEMAVYSGISGLFDKQDSKWRIHIGHPQGIERQTIIGLGDKSLGEDERCLDGIRVYMRKLRDRLRKTRVLCGDWKKAVGKIIEIHGDIIAVYLDPPYLETTGRQMDVYHKDDGEIANEVREWAIEKGRDPRYRIALSGYEGEHTMPAGWETFSWKGKCVSARSAGVGNQDRERVWFSPACLKI